MTAAGLLAEIRRRGGTVQLSADRVRIRPRAAAVGLESALRKHAAAILASLRRNAGQFLGSCYRCGAELPFGVEIALCAGCSGRRAEAVQP